MIFHVALTEAEDGWIVAECPALPGCISQGKDQKEALDNIKEAITAWLWAEDQASFPQKQVEKEIQIVHGYPLRGVPIQYERATDPVVESDWEANA